MRTEIAPTTALSGGNISTDSLAISTVILAAAYAVLQRDSLDVSDWSTPVSEGPWDGEPMAVAMEVERAASAPRFFALAFGLVLTASLRSVGVVWG